MPSGELVGTTLKFTGREVTDGHSHFPTDISDGFWRLTVWPEDSFNFAYVLPQQEGSQGESWCPRQCKWGGLRAHLCSAP